MSDTILAGDFTVYYKTENRQKRIEWSGSSTGTRTCNELYSALQAHFDELNQMDDGTPMSAQTPTEYTVGIIDAGDVDAWFIDRVTVEHLTGGALRSASWARVVDSEPGIVKLNYVLGAVGGVDLVTGDIGLTVQHSVSNAKGTLLDFVAASTVTGTMWIRPFHASSPNEWALPAPASSIDVSTGTGAQLTQTTSAITGESLWPNIFSIGTIRDNSHLYVQQNNALLTGYKSLTDWWSDGQIDILVNVLENGVEVDEGFVRVYARHYTATYDHFQVDLTAGGRNPIPLATGNDLDNSLGFFQMATTDASDDFTVGEIIQAELSADVQGIVTLASGTAPNLDVDYYLIGDPLDNFAGGKFVGLDSSASATVVGPAAINPSIWTTITVTHAARQADDIDEDGTPEHYSWAIDCDNHPLTEVYERMKYLARRGETASANTDGIEGQFYIGLDIRMSYASSLGTVNEGDVVTQVSTSATGTVVAHNTSATYVTLRASRGTFSLNDQVQVDGANYIGQPVSTRVITPIKAAPFGTFAGGTFFVAPGGVLLNVPSADTNNFQLVDDQNNVVTAPSKVTVLLSNTRRGDSLAIFKLTGAGGSIEKDTFTIDAAQAGATSNIVKVDPAITVDTVGRTAGGIIRVVHTSGGIEDRYRFASWATDEFTLATLSGTCTASGNVSTIVDNAADFVSTVVKGDIVYSSDEGAYAYVASILSSTDVQTTNVGSDLPITSWAGDNYMFNHTVRLYNTGDGAYVPFIDVAEIVGSATATGSESSILTYLADIPVRIRARQAGDILPYEADSTITDTGLSNAVIRAADTIFT